jgi:hypothetical protein
LFPYVKEICPHMHIIAQFHNSVEISMGKIVVINFIIESGASD